jgi:PTH1 family peptidyl-tRNA hydrolase
VLGKWTKEEEPIVKKKIDLAVDVISNFATQGLTYAMNQVNNHRVEL